MTTSNDPMAVVYNAECEKNEVKIKINIKA